jgi:hypothetical protein
MALVEYGSYACSRSRSYLKFRIPLTDLAMVGNIRRFATMRASDAPHTAPPVDGGTLDSISTKKSHAQ